MGWIIGLLVEKGLSEKWVRIAAIASLFLLILGALGVGKCSYDRSVISRHNAAQAAKQAKRERKADNNLNQQKKIDEQAAIERKKEIDNATRNIPDKAPSARQRARACIELQRQSAAQGRPKPAC